MKYQIKPSSELHGEIRVPGDKSVSHRSIILGSIAEGKTEVSRVLEGEDVLATINAFRKMGVNIQRHSEDPEDNNYTIEGVGLYGLQNPGSELDLGNSGTAFRLLCGLLCGQSWPSTLTGDESLMTRPMGRVIRPLMQMGAKIKSNQEKPPIEISAKTRLQGIEYEIPMASAQVKSAILLAGLYANGETSVMENAPTRDHTERMLSGFGYNVQKSGYRLTVEGHGKLSAQYVQVPSDLSSAAFFILGVLISTNSELLLKNVGINPSRNGVIGILQRMGGQIYLERNQVIGGEPVADIRVKSSNLNSIEIAGSDIALAIDEIPVIAVAAACAEGRSIIKNAQELRVKESDRIKSIVDGLAALGIGVVEKQDGMEIVGGSFKSGTVKSYSDHRIAMAFTMAATVANGPVEIQDVKNVATSFPDFYPLCQSVGVNIETIL